MTRKEPLPIIAIIGCDGSGKTTVCLEVTKWLNEIHPTRLCHLGRQTGNIRRYLVKLPFLGNRLDKNISKKNKKAKSNEGPGGLLALGIFILSFRRVFRFSRMLYQRSKGAYIITDRYPQLSVLGGLDGPDLTTPHPASRMTRILTTLERLLYHWMTDHVPDLVIRLNVDLETAIQRKPDHCVASLEKKINSLQRLTYKDAPILDIDNNHQSLETTLEQVKAAILNVLNQKTAPETEK